MSGERSDDRLDTASFHDAGLARGAQAKISERSAALVLHFCVMWMSTERLDYRLDTAGFHDWVSARVVGREDRESFAA